MEQDHGPEQSGYAGTKRPNLKDVNAAYGLHTSNPRPSLARVRLSPLVVKCAYKYLAKDSMQIASLKAASNLMGNLMCFT